MYNIPIEEVDIVKDNESKIGKMDWKLKNCFLLRSRGEGHHKSKINVFIQN